MGPEPRSLRGLLFPTPPAITSGERRPPAWRFLKRVGTLLLVAAAVAALVILAEEQATVAGLGTATDGDTLRVGDLAIRLAGIDAPELRQSCTRDERPTECGVDAKAELARLVEGSVVRCRIEGRDRYRRYLARCRAGGADLGAVLVRSGLALSYDGGYDREEAQARAEKAGLWAGSFVDPAEWRREHLGPPRS